METSKREIIQSLELMFKKAENENLWFYCRYQELWFSPKELKKEQEENERFIWGSINWELRSPYERIDQLERQISRVNNEIEDIKKRINNE